MHSIERLLNTVEVASILGISTRQVSRLRDRGEIPQPVKIGRRRLHHLSDILNYIETLKYPTQA